MARTRAYKSDGKAAIHETALDLHEAGLIDKHTMRRFDQSCLTPVRKFSAAEIRALREREQVSQTVFCRVSQCHRGFSEPMGAGRQTTWWHSVQAVVHRCLKGPFGHCLSRGTW